MVNAGMQHLDLKWSHVGSYIRIRGRDKKESIVLFDLARVKEGVEPDVARKAMFKALALGS
ncbi:hypothetical protein HK097_008234 [Rhizophlyctis rosea]|uniref:Uncharacterized protein n=1 Tax=Rhizophlyctis rosea TaxID=64517 RepID=A0AAD5SC32_9FUNG|nr:hypothetical protein HK097_008234 [Rhizophlyctis rosea]